MEGADTLRVAGSDFSINRVVMVAMSTKDGYAYMAFWVRG